MRDHAIWSIGAGRWQGTVVRVHMFFLLFAALTLYLSWLDAHRVTGAEGQGPVWAGWACLAILLVSVAVHELGHVLVARKLGAQVDEVVLGPVGGLGSLPQGMEPQAEMVMVVAGPLANLGMCLMAALCLAVQGDTDLAGLMNPLAPSDMIVGSFPIVVMKLTYWTNWLLALINLIPAFPFDGGRIFRAGLVLTQITPDSYRAGWIVTRVAKLTAVGFLMAAWFVRNQNPASLIQPWFAFVLLAIFVYFSARKEELLTQNYLGDDDLPGYDFSEGYTSLERSSSSKLTTKPMPGPLVRWWQKRREEREQRQRELEKLEEGLVDEILLRVHQTGMQSLSNEDRAVLQRVSARYRNRPVSE